MPSRCGTRGVLSKLYPVFVLLCFQWFLLPVIASGCVLTEWLESLFLCAVWFSSIYAGMTILRHIVHFSGLYCMVLGQYAFCFIGKNQAFILQGECYFLKLLSKLSICNTKNEYFLKKDKNIKTKIK